jgi:uncharacterized protein YbjT (DUF2867 family)
MTTSNRVLVVGGTRGTGLLIARLLDQRGDRIRILARDPSNAMEFGSAVEVLSGDVTRPETLGPAMREAEHVVYTAGVRSGRMAGERRIKQTDYEGVVNTLAVARQYGMPGRFLYMTSIGGLTTSISATLLNIFKGNVLVWRRRAEDEIRASGLDYTVVRAGFLLNSPGLRRQLLISQGDLPLEPRYRISRADVAEVCVGALRHPRAARATFEVVWGPGRDRALVDDPLSQLLPDAAAG